MCYLVLRICLLLAATVHASLNLRTVDYDCANAAWAQCGGVGYFGSTCCASGYVCHVESDYYSGCMVEPSPVCSPTLTTISVDFSPLDPSDLFYVQVSKPGQENTPFALVTTKIFPIIIEGYMQLIQAHTTFMTMLRCVGLSPNTSYSIAIAAHDPAAPSIAWEPSWARVGDSVSCATLGLASSQESAKATIGISTASSFLRTYRISEYSFEVDFLENHDSGDGSMVADFLGACVWSVDELTARWDSCQASTRPYALGRCASLSDALAQS